MEMKKFLPLLYISLFLSCATGNPGQTASYYLVSGITAYNERNYSRAAEDFNQSIRVNPNNANAYIVRGIIFFRSGDYDSAIADFETALRLEPSNTDAREALNIARAEKLWKDR